MDMSLEGRVAIVTGGGTGLGRGYAAALAGAGAAVAVTGRRREPLEECAAEIEKNGGSALAVPCDQRSRDEMDLLRGIISRQLRIQERRREAREVVMEEVQRLAIEDNAFEVALDLFAQQELKLTDEQFPREPFEALGYHVVSHGQKAWNGVAILAREEPEVTQVGLPGQEDMGARLITATVAGVASV